MTFKEKMAEIAASEPQRFVDWLMETGRKMEWFKSIKNVDIEPISEKEFRIPFKKI